MKVCRVLAVLVCEFVQFVLPYSHTVNNGWSCPRADSLSTLSTVKTSRLMMERRMSSGTRMVLVPDALDRAKEVSVPNQESRSSTLKLFGWPHPDSRFFLGPNQTTISPPNSISFFCAVVISSSFPCNSTLTDDVSSVLETGDMIVYRTPEENHRT